MISVREYPSLTGPGFLDNLLTIPHEFIVSQSFAIIDRPVAQSHIDRVARQVDMSSEAESVVAEHLGEARDELLASESLYGEHHMTVMALGKTLAGSRRDDHGGRRGPDRSLRDLGARRPQYGAGLLGAVAREFPLYRAKRDHQLEAMSRASCLCTITRAARRRTITGGRRSRCFKRRRRRHISTISTSADLGNFTVVGPSGSGKTVWLSFIAAQAQRVEPRPKLVFIDKDRGAEIFIRALGGQYEALDPGTPTGFNPADAAGQRRKAGIPVPAVLLHAEAGARRRNPDVLGRAGHPQCDQDRGLRPAAGAEPGSLLIAAARTHSGGRRRPDLAP